MGSKFEALRGRVAYDFTLAYDLVRCLYGSRLALIAFYARGLRWAGIGASRPLNNSASQPGV